MDKIFDSHYYTVADTGVVADLVVYLDDDGSHSVQIYGWSSNRPGEGNTNAALAVLRRTWPGTISAHDCGLADHPETSESYRYWQHQLRTGRIDQAFDDDLDPVPVN